MALIVWMRTACAEEKSDGENEMNIICVIGGK